MLNLFHIALQHQSLISFLAESVTMTEILVISVMVIITEFCFCSGRIMHQNGKRSLEIVWKNIMIGYCGYLKYECCFIEPSSRNDWNKIIKNKIFKQLNVTLLSSRILLNNNNILLFIFPEVINWPRNLETFIDCFIPLALLKLASIKLIISTNFYNIFPFPWYIIILLFQTSSANRSE